MWQRLPYIFPFACNACCLRAPWTRAVIVRTMNEPARSVVLRGAGKMLEQVLLLVTAISRYSRHVPRGTL